MKIAIVINTSWNIYNFRGGLIKAMQEQGWEVIAIAPYDMYADKLVEEYNVRYVPVKMQNKGTNPVNDYMLIKLLKKIYKQEQPDIILQYTIKPNIYGSLAAKALGIPVINNVSGLGTAFIRENFVTKIAATLYRHSFKTASKVFFQNEDDRGVFLERKLINKNKTDLLPGSGVDLEKFSPQNTSSNTFSFLFIARLIFDKGIMEFIHAAELLKNKGINARFNVLGFIDDVANLGMTVQQVRDWEKKGVINYLGAVEDIREKMSKATVVVLPSYREGTPKSLLEALAMAKPIVTTDVPGCRETVKDGYNGFLCEVKNVESLAGKMEKMYALTAEELLQMGRNSRTYAEEKFDEKIVVNKYIEAIKEIGYGN